MNIKNNTERLNEVISQSLYELLNDFKVQQEKGGWHQYFNSKKIGNVATSQALLILKQFRVELKHKDKAFNFLLHEQKESHSISINGGWSYVTNTSDISNTESTCWVLQALHSDVNSNESFTSKGVNWLIANFINEDAGWGTTKDSGFRIYSTCVALRTLKLFEKTDEEEYLKATQTLRRAQNIDGGWSESAGGRSTLAHTAHCVLTLLDIGLNGSSEVLKGVKWIEKCLEKEQASDAEMGLVENVEMKYNDGRSKEQRITFYHMPEPYALRALIRIGKSPVKFIHQRILELIERSDHGHWSHPYVHNKRTLWSMFDMLTLFYEFKESRYFKNFDTSKPRMNGEKKKFDIIVFTIVPAELKALNTVLNFSSDLTKPDHKIRSTWYYEHSIEVEGGFLSCLITMIGNAGEVQCSNICNKTFTKFDCDLAILCGIAAGNQKEITKYSAIISTTIVAYEYQRLEVHKKTYRPKFFNVDLNNLRLIEKSAIAQSHWNQLITECFSKLKLDIKKEKSINVRKIGLHNGVIASGSKLIADGKMLGVLRSKIPVEKGIAALDMESGGFAPTCEENNTKWIVIRGISDYGAMDKNKRQNKKLQPVAVASAAASLLYYLKFFYAPDKLI